MIFIKQFFIPLFISFFFYKLIISKFATLISDIPNNRSSHNFPKATSGGIVFAILSTILNVFNSNFLFLQCLPLAIFGLIDDKFNLKAILRYLIQLIVCGTLVFYSDLGLPVIFQLLVIFAGSGIINFTNFMDGIDGLVAGCMLIILSSLYILKVYELLPLIAGLLAFLFWNWSPSKIFMGDSGSTFLGGIFFGVLLKIHDPKTLIGVLLISTPLLGDAAFCVIKRFWAGKNIFKAHRSHLYQRLQRAGFSHTKVSIIYILGTLTLAFSFIILNLKYTIFIAILELFVIYYIDKNFAISFENS